MLNKLRVLRVIVFRPLLPSLCQLFSTVNRPDQVQHWPRNNSQPRPSRAIRDQVVLLLQHITYHPAYNPFPARWLLPLHLLPPARVTCHTNLRCLAFPKRNVHWLLLESTTVNPANNPRPTSYNYLHHFLSFIRLHLIIYYLRFSNQAPAVKCLYFWYFQYFAFNNWIS